MVELAKWNMRLRKWRERNGHTTPEWESYVKAINIQYSYVVMLYFVVGIAVGLFFK